MIQRLSKRVTQKDRQGGFTLIELLVVIAIIAVLIALAGALIGFIAAAAALAIAMLVLGFNFLGDGLRDRVDPKMVR